MKLLSLTLSGYRQFQTTTDLEIPGGLIGICGPNGVGKSKLIEALGFCLFGPHSQVLPSGDKASDLPSVATAGGASAGGAQGGGSNGGGANGGGSRLQVAVTLELAGQTIEVVRTLGAGTLVRLMGDEEPLAQSPRNTTAKVVELLGLTPDAFHSTCVARQKEIALLQNLPAAARTKVVNRLIGVTAFEEAIKAADVEFTKRQSWFESLNLRAEQAVMMAQKAAEESEGALQTATAAEIALNQSVDAVEQRLKTSSVNISRLRVEMARLKQRQEELGRLETEQEQAKETEEAAELDLTNVTQSAQIVLEASKVAAEFSFVPEQLKIEKYLEKREALGDVLDALELDLTDLQQQIKQVGYLRGEMEARAQALRDLRLEHGKRESQRSALAERVRQAEQEILIRRRRTATARRLGTDGACEACGQQFGSSLTNAMAHLAGEEADATKKKKEAFEQEQEQGRLRDAAAAQISEVEEQLHWLTEQQRQLSGAEVARNAVEKQFELTLREFQTLPTQMGLGEVPEENASFDPVHWEALEKSVEALDRAKELLLTHSGLAARLEPAQKAANDAATRRSSIQLRLDELAAEIAHIDFLTGQIEKRGCLLDSQQALFNIFAEQHAEATERRIAAQVAQASASQLQKGARDLGDEASRAGHESRVCEHTRILLKQMLDSIIDEARPRIAQLMENWCRSLMGPHFQSIDLTTDYLVQANNGSGLHQIQHFSGGEQTLLAVMLRVAIAIYCQERAGVEAGFLILDEVFGDQDEIHRDHLVQFLQEIQPHFHQILIVNHIEAVTEQLDSIIQVEELSPKSSRAVLQS